MSSTIAKLLTLLLPFIVLYHGFNYIQTLTRRRRLVREHGCQDLTSLPSNDPILGLDTLRTMSESYKHGRRSRVFKEQHDATGSTFQSVALGRKRVFTRDPVNIQAIFSTNFPDWGVEPLRLKPWKPLLGAGVMDTDGAHWKHSRGLVQPLFRREQVLDMQSFDVHVSRLLTHLPDDGSMVNMQQLFAQLILDFTTEFLFGTSVASLSSEPDKEALQFLKAFQYGQAGMGKRTQMPYWTTFTWDKQFTDSCKLVRKFVERYIERAVIRSESTDEEKKGQKYVLADELVTMTTDREEIRSQLLNTFLAAHDTTAVLLTNVFFNLARNPDVFQDVRKEILDADIDLTNVDELNKLVHLRNLVNESSRFTPVVGQSARFALRDTVLPTGGGPDQTAPVLIKQGTSVQFNYWALHRRPDVFGEDTDVFRPSRWNGLQIGHWDFLPFSGGPRVCPAQQMATTQVKFAVARILSQFKAIENRDEVLEFVERYRITSDSKNGCKIALIPA